jgi:hypothetical protein
MKTPMQEMIEYFEIFQGADKSNQSMPLGIAISIAKSLLEKEKEVMIDFAFKYGDLTMREMSDSFDKEYK